MAGNTVTPKNTIKQERKETPETATEFMNHVRKELKNLESCDFEEFKMNMIAVTEDLFKAVLMIFEETLKGRQEFIELAVEQIKDIRAVNDEDFKKAERNFKHVEKELEEFEKRVSKAEAGAILSLMRSSAVLVRMFKGGFISYDEIMDPEQKFRVVTKELKKCIADVFGISQKSMKNMIQKVSEAA